MTDQSQDEIIANVINDMTEKLSNVLMQEFLKLPDELQMNIVMIKSAQLLLANILCHVAANNDELVQIADEQGVEMKELVFNCAYTGFGHKFDVQKH